MSNANSADRSICIVTCQLEGFDKNGGIGTATRYLCEHLRQAGRRVHLYYTHEERPEYAPVRQHLESLGVAVNFINGAANVFHAVERRPYRVYEALRQTDFDIYLFPDWQGEGFFCSLAKESGAAFRHSTLGVVLHSPTAWCCEANRRFIAGEAELALVEMERGAIERADFVLSPSQYMIDWVRQRGWQLPNDARVIPNFANPPAPVRGRPAAAADAAPDAPRQIAFFGRLEERKGVYTFIDALQRLSADLLPQLRVAFLGSACDLKPPQLRERLGRRLLTSLAACEIHTDFSSQQAQDYLLRHQCLAVMPSHVDNSPCVVWECLERGIPFILSDQGGGQEMLAVEDRAAALFAPNGAALAAKLAECVRNPRWPRARPAYKQRDILARWDALFQDLDSRGATRPERPSPAPFTAAEATAPPSLPTGAGETLPLVSIVLVHHNRPHLAAHSLASLMAQDYANKEVVLVDDGSDDPAAAAFLQRIEAELAPPCPVRVVRQENRYLGAARNAGMRATQGSLLVFFDDDNVARPRLVSELVRAMQHSGADCVSCGERFFFAPDGRPTEGDESNQRMMYWGGATRLSGLFANHFGDAVGLYRREIIERVGGFHELFGVTHEDWQLYAAIRAAGGRIATVPEDLFWYRASADGMFRSTNVYRNLMQSSQPFRAMLPELWQDAPELILGLWQHARRVRRAPSLRQRIAGLPVVGPWIRGLKRRWLDR